MALKGHPWEPLREDVSRLIFTCNLIDIHFRVLPGGKLTDPVDARVDVLGPPPPLPLLTDSPQVMMMTFITRRGEGQGRTKKGRKATKSKGSGLEEGASRALSVTDTNRSRTLNF